VRKVIDFVNQKWPTPIFLIGHSAGTTSVAYLAAVLKDPPNWWRCSYRRAVFDRKATST
jgi:hypothetical protein